MSKNLRLALIGAVFLGGLSLAGAANAQVTFSGSYSPAQIQLNDTSVVTLSTANLTGATLTAGTFNYTFPSGTWNFTSSSGCAGGTINNNGGSSTVTLTNLTVNAGSTCNINFTIRPNTAGVKPLASSTITYSGADGASPKSLTAGANPTLTVIAPVPTMSEWAMILFAAILAGGAALHVQRRRMTA